MKEWLKRLLWEEDQFEKQRWLNIQRQYRRARFFPRHIAIDAVATYEAEKRRRKEKRREAREARRNSKGKPSDEGNG